MFNIIDNQSGEVLVETHSMSIVKAYIETHKGVVDSREVVKRGESSEMDFHVDFGYRSGNLPYMYL